MRRFTTILLTITLALSLAGCSLLDDELNRVEVCTTGLAPGDAFTLYCARGPVECLSGEDGSLFAASANGMDDVRHGALAAAALDGGMRWKGSGTADFFAVRAVDASLVDWKGYAVGPVDVPAVQEWAPAAAAVPMVAGMTMAERGIPVCLSFAPAVTVVTLVFPRLKEGVSVKGVEVVSSKSSVSGRYTIDMLSGAATVEGSASGGRVTVDMTRAVEDSTGVLSAAVRIIPQRYRMLQAEVALLVDGKEETLAVTLCEEPYGRIVEPFSINTIMVALPSELADIEEEVI